MKANERSDRGVLSDDTSGEAERLQVRVWRSLSSLERARLIAGASRAARAMALAGLRDRHPDASERELVAQLALITAGPALAARVYPDLDGLLDRAARE